MSQITDHIGKIIEQARKKKGLTQKGLGEKLGIGEPTVSKYESGKQNPTVETLQRIADVLGVELNISFK